MVNMNTDDTDEADYEILKRWYEVYEQNDDIVTYPNSLKHDKTLQEWVNELRGEEFC